ncbi:MAG: hypothetical protein C0608_00850 [Deltaproteobacteria bacterium]|nr:MAG: hypothetical protein C0608_00850 [Deltaproteobacteria bacterium]
MILVHPIMQVFFIAMAAVAFILGSQRFRSNHLGHQTRFNWKGHVYVGRIAIVGLILGTVAGIAITPHYFEYTPPVLSHGLLGLVSISFFLVGAVTGYILDKHRKKRKILPLIHGTANTVALILTLNQIKSGYALYISFVGGG